MVYYCKQTIETNTQALFVSRAIEEHQNQLIDEGNPKVIKRGKNSFREEFRP